MNNILCQKLQQFSQNRMEKNHYKDTITLIMCRWKNHFYESYCKFNCEREIEKMSQGCQDVANFLDEMIITGKRRIEHTRSVY